MADRGQNGERLRGEEAIIHVLAPLAQGAPGAFDLGDDCALLSPSPGTELVLKTDPVAEGVHFLAEDAPEDIAWKALAVNVSDIAAKAARPLGYLMALSFPEAPAAAWMERFAAGLQAAQESFGCRLLGGDTDRRPGPLTITITLIGEVPAGGMVRRGAARAGEAIFVSGTLGDAALGLMLRKSPDLAAQWGLSADEAAYLIGRYVRPQPRLGLATALRQHASAAMDVSDGLAKDLARMCAASGCGAHVRLADVPRSAAVAKAVACDATLATKIAAGGDDYEVLAAVPESAAAAFRSEALGGGVPVTRIGTMSACSDVVVEDTHGLPLALERTGWDHF
ncbi:MAG TPA: thiamine-phosphate kinase [Hyphomicrobiaceae bacterium]|nr:thiamine-phosphate kinase [Hyphomicrobiaceae bacterium]